MKPEQTRVTMSSRGIASIQSGLLLFGYTILLTFFMGAVIFINGGGG